MPFAAALELIARQTRLPFRSRLPPCLRTAVIASRLSPVHTCNAGTLFALFLLVGNCCLPDLSPSRPNRVSSQAARRGGAPHVPETETRRPADEGSSPDG